MKLIGQFCIRKVLGEIVAVPIDESLQHFSGIVSLNEVGKFLMEKLETEQTPESLVAAVTEEYDVDKATAEKDVADFLGILKENELIR